MPYALIAIVALLASGLTFFSGFGLGTLLMPAFAVFVPVSVAVGATAVVHLANNLFKLWLVGKHADKQVLLRFAPSAVLCAILGAALLGLLATVLPDGGVLHQYTFGTNGREFSITIVKLVIAAIILAFAIAELHPKFDALAFDRKWLWLGGAISGLFGGLSGHQGALRSAFLIRCGLSKDAFVATGVVASVLVDCSRLVVYALFALGIIGSGKHVIDFGSIVSQVRDSGIAPLVAVGCAAALAGSLIGQRLVAKVTLTSLRRIVGIALIAFAIALGAGAI